MNLKIIEVFTATPINWRCESIAFEIVVKHNEFNTFIEDFILNNEEIRLQTKVDLFEYITKELEKIHMKRTVYTRIIIK